MSDAMGRLTYLCWAALLFGLTIVVVGCEKEPRNYDDCVLRYVKPGMDTAAAGLLTESCENKFPRESAPKAKVRNLSREELERLTGRGSPSAADNGYFLGTLYNGNADVRVTKISVTVRTVVNGEKLDRAYDTTVSLSPKSADTFGFKFIPGDRNADVPWSVMAASGEPLQIVDKKGE